MTKQTKPSDGKSTVYMATNLVNGKRYIGITIRYLSKRKADHLAAAKGGAPTTFARALRKYGIDKFRFEALARLDMYEDAKKMEIFLISSMKPEYNQSLGGDGYLGYVPTEDAKRKIREANIGRPGYWKGKSLPDHVRALGRAAMNIHPKKKQILAMGPMKRRRKIVCIDDGVIYESIKFASDAYGVSAGSISAVCMQNTCRKSAGGMKFKFVEASLG